MKSPLGRWLKTRSPSNWCRFFYRFFLGGGRVPLLKQTTEKKSTLILTSLLEDLEDYGSGARHFSLWFHLPKCHDWCSCLSLCHQLEIPQGLIGERDTKQHTFGIGQMDTLLWNWLKRKPRRNRSLVSGGSPYLRQTHRIEGRLTSRVGLLLANPLRQRLCKS